MTTIKPNDKVRIIKRYNGGILPDGTKRIVEETFYAIVKRVEDRAEGQYFGYEPIAPPSDDKEALPRWACGHWGCRWNLKEPKQFSARVEVVGHVEPVRSPDPPNLFRNPSYDLMHDPIRRRP